MTDISELLAITAGLAADHLAGLDDAPVFPRVTPEELRDALAVPLPDGPQDPGDVVHDLATAAAPGLVAIPGGRYFGFVTGGAVPASLAADWLTSAWDQNAFSYVSSPAAAVIEEVAAAWVKEILGLPPSASTAFVTGCQMAHVTCLAAARHHVLRGAGWDVAVDGLGSAPPVRVVCGEMRHVTVDRALRLLGIGTGALVPVAVDDQGRMLVDALTDALAAGAGPVIVVAQAGEVNTGSFEPLRQIVAAAREHDAWVHVDGAFGIWARASRALAHHLDGLEDADSWAFDGHKWLNVPYDSGVAVVAHPESHRAAMVGEAAYLTPTPAERDAIDWTPDASRRARGIPIYAALRSLGRSGVEEIVDRCCAHARRFAAGLSGLPGAEILNDVVLNQVLVRFTDDATTVEVLRRVQESGVAWMGSTSWQGQPAIRISVSSWATTDEDVDRTIAAFSAAAASLG